MLRPASSAWHPPVLTISALERRGIDGVWTAIEAHRAAIGPAGIATRRAAQAKATLWREISDLVRETLVGEPALAALVESLETKVSQGLESPYGAAGRVVAALREGGG
jgi:LAO/AO transport system kinase